VNTTSTAITRPDRRRWHLGLLSIGLICGLLGLLGCGGKSAAPQAPSNASIIQSLVNDELGPYNAPGHKVPPPGPFQQALLRKTRLTFADYQSAMQAAADCMKQRIPGATVQLRPQPGWTQIYTFDVASGGGAAGSVTQGN
jgi:ABC-type glycerol-3-phosphate transport system substrate-binding protein